MKKSERCIKCNNKRLWIVDEVKQPDVDSSNRTWTMAVTSHEIESRRKPRGSTENRISAGTFQVIVCAACGYTEWYANDFERLAEVPGARLVGGDKSDAGPYR